MKLWDDCSINRRVYLTLTLAVAIAAVLPFSLPAYAGFTEIKKPADARRLGLDSLRYAIHKDGGVPLPKTLDEYIKNRRAAIELGKALFWDMQVGSDGVQACASCHFHAGADNRATNQINPNTTLLLNMREDDVNGYFNAQTVGDTHFETKGPNAKLTREDFPFVRRIQSLKVSSAGTVGPAAGNSNDITGSMGIFFTFFNGIQPGMANDFGTRLADPVFHAANGQSVRQTEPRNAPSVINAVFNFTNFWDGRANHYFNGQDHFGEQNPFAGIRINTPTGLVRVHIALDNGSLASQTLGPPASTIEMSFGDPSQGNRRSFPDIAKKLLEPGASGQPIVPLGQQLVHRFDSTLGHLSNAPQKGLNTSYAAMIKRAFFDKYWNSDAVITRGSDGAKFNQMEANFSLFFGLAVELYEATLVADRTPFDRWMETGRFGLGFGRDELAGLNIFANQAKCINCHAGPELTKASIRSAQNGNAAIRAMKMAKGAALYDVGFYNIGITPTTDDIGRGDRDPVLGQPLAFSRQALFDRLGISQIDFAIIGNHTLPAIAEDSISQVCDDVNGNGLCDPGEMIKPDFQRVAVDGAFKTPGLRNVALTGPYFHNGGVATLRQVVQFYNRGGNFCSFNASELDPHIQPLGLTARQERQLVAFLVALTDWRVKYQAAPFDHPELRLPADGLDEDGSQSVAAVGAWGSVRGLKPFLDLNPQDAIFTPAGGCVMDAF